MEKSFYTVTLNFFVPEEVVENLKEVKITGKVIFDWRKTNFAHCTVKAIYHATEIPNEKLIKTWVGEAKKVLAKQKSFEAVVKGITHWKTALVSNVESKELFKIHRKLFKVLPGIQPHFEDGDYHAHVSLARTVGEVMAVAPTGKTFGKFKVDEIQLMLWGMRDLKKPKVLERFKLESGKNRD